MIEKPPAELREIFERFKPFYVMHSLNRTGQVETLDLRRGKETTDAVLSLVRPLTNLRRLSLSDTAITDRGLGYLSQLTQLEDLYIRQCKGITDLGMKHVAALGSLKQLQLYGLNVGDEGVRQLETLPFLEEISLPMEVTNEGMPSIGKLISLRRLTITNTRVTDEGLASLASLEKLETLDLREGNFGAAPFTDKGVAHLQLLVNLKWLYLKNNRITGEGIKHLAQLVNLEILDLGKTLVKDPSLCYLKGLGRLRDLILSNTSVSDKGLEYLRGLSKLRTLHVEGTKVSKTGKAELKKVLKKCVILVGESEDDADDQDGQPVYDADYFDTHPPECIRGFHTAKSTANRRTDGGTIQTQFRLLCKCGGNRGFILGFPLSSLNQEYKGPMVFVSPLAFCCAKCDKRTEIIDTNEHGYDGQLGNSVNYRGKGKRSQFECPKCRGQEMEVTVGFSYGGGERDLTKDDPDISVEDFFDSFSAKGKCAKCGKRTSVADFELA